MYDAAETLSPMSDTTIPVDRELSAFVPLCVVFLQVLVNKIERHLAVVEVVDCLSIPVQLTTGCPGLASLIVLVDRKPSPYLRRTDRETTRFHWFRPQGFQHRYH